MATQHPDNAGVSPFTGKRLVTTTDEIDECFKCFSELGVHEYMWDWEGKLVDEAVIDRLYQKHFDYFKQFELGKELFLTFRIPNIWEEKTHRLPRAFMNVFAAEHAARNYGFHSPPIFELILPMTTSGSQLIELQKMFRQMADASSAIFGMQSDLKRIKLIPLVESIETMANTEILEEYANFMTETDEKPSHLRVFMARSDPAMNAGLIPTMLTVKNALSKYHDFEARTGIKIYPWVGGGSLPFRGGMNPENKEAIVQEYKGISSLTIQSAFRCDYPMDEVKEAIRYFNEVIPQERKNFIPVSPEESKTIEAFNKKAQAVFQATVEPLAKTINQIAKQLPSNRERTQHVGLFGYARGMGKVTLPRAIKFTGSLYSLGVPPEFISSGRILKMAKEEGCLDLIEKLYINLRADMRHAGKYFNRENLDLLCKVEPAFEPIKEDIALMEEYLGDELGPQESKHYLHRNHTSNIFYLWQMGESAQTDILEAAKLRKSLG